MTNACSHVGLCVRDLERSRRFYEDVFGFRSAFSFASDDAMTAKLLRLASPLRLDAAYLWLDGLLLELMVFEPSEPRPERAINEPGLTHLSFFVDDIAATKAAVEAHGGCVRSDTDLGVAVFVEDPDGQPIELLEAAGRFHSMRADAIAALDP